MIEQYGYKKDYFLVDWLDRTGFRQIIGLVDIDADWNFCVLGFATNFIRMDNIIDVLI